MPSKPNLNAMKTKIRCNPDGGKKRPIINKNGNPS
jgi:hypothetical protein